jgi:hypothetical protein
VLERVRGVGWSMGREVVGVCVVVGVDVCVDMCVDVCVVCVGVHMSPFSQPRMMSFTKQNREASNFSTLHHSISDICVRQWPSTHSFCSFSTTSIPMRV